MTLAGNNGADVITVFHMVRDDRIVADGVQWSDGQCNVKWRGAYRSNAVWDDFTELAAVSGHGSADDPKSETLFRVVSTIGGTP